jgi:hypothetical protein
MAASHAIWPCGCMTIAIDTRRSRYSLALPGSLPGERTAEELARFRRCDSTDQRELTVSWLTAAAGMP